MSTRADREIEMWTELLPNGRVEWTIRVDGEDHGGGTTSAQWEAFQDAANYLRDRMLLAEMDAETPRSTARRAFDMGAITNLRPAGGPR